MDFTKSDPKSYLQAAIGLSMKGGTVSPVELCMGIEATLKAFSEHRKYVTRLKLEMGANGVFVAELQTKDKQPDNWNIEGLWYVLYHLMTDKAPMRIASVTLGHNKKPQVEYDDSLDNGLPVSFNRPYDGEKAAGLMRKGVVGGPN